MEMPGTAVPVPEDIEDIPVVDMEQNCIWVSTDGDYARFEGLSVLNPLA